MRLPDAGIPQRRNQFRAALVGREKRAALPRYVVKGQRDTLLGMRWLNDGDERDERNK